MARAYSDVCSCDPHRPRGAGAAAMTKQRALTADLSLRSSPAPGGRCCTTSPASVPAGRVNSCDPHRPRGAGAAPGVAAPGGRQLAGCDPHRPRGAGAARTRRHRDLPLGRVAILTGPGGPVLLVNLAVATRRDWAVAILTGPGGPVLRFLNSEYNRPGHARCLLVESKCPVMRHSRFGTSRVPRVYLGFLTSTSTHRPQAPKWRRWPGRGRTLLPRPPRLAADSAGGLTPDPHPP